jgi:hypothetical protein
MTTLPVSSEAPEGSTLDLFSADSSCWVTYLSHLKQYTDIPSPHTYLLALIPGECLSTGTHISMLYLGFYIFHMLRHKKHAVDLGYVVVGLHGVRCDGVERLVHVFREQSRHWAG